MSDKRKPTAKKNGRVQDADFVQDHLDIPDEQDTPTDSAARPKCCCSDMSRRRFIQVAGVSAAAMSALGETTPPAVAGPFEEKDRQGHFIPADKKLSPEWIKRLFDRGESTVYRGKNLETIAMPIGGICAGHLYLTGDGRLAHWNILNQREFTGWGATHYKEHRKPDASVEQGFALRVTSGGKTITRTLDVHGFPDVAFRGEYPIGTVSYPDASLPAAVTLEAYSPFVPLDELESSLPATVLEYTVKNTSAAPIDVTLAGWLENIVSRISANELKGRRENRVILHANAAMVVGRAEGVAPTTNARPPRVLADFEGGDYGDWKAEGKAFGAGPAKGTLPRQEAVRGHQGKGLVNSFLDGDASQGTLTSPEFTIDRSYLCFLLGGGAKQGETCLNLLIDGKKVRTAVGQGSETLAWKTWDVSKLQGKKARLRIVDKSSESWGHILVDQIELRDTPRSGRRGTLEDQEDFGELALAVLPPFVKNTALTPDAAAGLSSDVAHAISVRAVAALPEGKPPEVIFPSVLVPDESSDAARAAKPLGEKLVGAVGASFTLQPGEEIRVPFLVAWSFPKRADRGKTNFYAKRFSNAVSVVGHVAKQFDDLRGKTRLWHDAWYDSTLPHWLLERLFSTTSILATGTCYWWGNGRFWAYEGVGCCPGTCAHVWNYVQAMGRLFPRLERSVREMQDFGVGFVPESGEIHFRGESCDIWAGDGQAGAVLKAYREHKMTSDDKFLRRNWPRIRKALEFLMNEDRNENGILEGKQHNTYDLNFQGPNTMVGSLYLAALRAAEEMAELVGDDAFAKRCRTLFGRGSKWTAEHLFNGEYFFQKVDVKKYKLQYADGCLSDQLFGQTWAHQLGLGYVYPKEMVQAALKSVWKYNWAPDVGPQNKRFKPGRWFAKPGEGGLLTCTWPRGDRVREPMLYRDEVWTGIEYQVATHMVHEGMITEALAVCRAIHERYHPSKRNPWNEVECGDHYARAMASHGVFLALCGFENDGPKGHLGFAPRITPEDFRGAFATVDAWGTFEQKRADGVQTERLAVKWGKASLRTLSFQLPEGKKLVETTVLLDGEPLGNAAVQQAEGRVIVTPTEPMVVAEGKTLEVRLKY